MTLKTDFELVKDQLQNDIVRLEAQLFQGQRQLDYMKATLRIVEAEEKMLTKKEMK